MGLDGGFPPPALRATSPDYGGGIQEGPITDEGALRALAYSAACALAASGPICFIAPP
jgi:hypothetical protein